ncbi:LOW QUALITY PROTEIN: uncharacterized protein BDZ83DRAFT_720088 [Colletotrichum acutatum]|uniref:Uncharacterized protein n=1 Tax=Glomerella acutata TaxID=27357 RepID=A0AAD8XE09_GLOAC|nr:LOW QUALITY PROTEIN: uncharacterized protein BDZ83DRAFT_720088 [Colletotrichum acutatum]KAK1724304.1 LOW QUALITY PROTEIN: hypothetical protein BDZ83DRAFT_720088 [Colletotrichum acutatum]
MADAVLAYSNRPSLLEHRSRESGFTVILLTLITELDIPQGPSVWPATAFSLVIASTLLIFGRLGNIFSINPLMLDFCRALQGLCVAASLPTGVMLMGSLHRPGPRKNLVFAVYGTSAILDFFVGILVAGIVGQFKLWGLYFWIGAILTALTLLTSLFNFTFVHQPPSEAKMDYPGAMTILCGLILVVFSVLQSAHAPTGWRTPYVSASLSLGVLSLLTAGYSETRVSPQPLLPASIFTTPRMSPLLVALFLLYGTWGIFSVFGTLYFQDIIPLQMVAWYTPLGVAGLILSVIEGFILHLVPGHVLLVISGLNAVFPVVVLSTVGIDLSTILITVFVTTAFPTSQQGLARSVLGVAIVFGLSGKSYKNTIWFGVGAAAGKVPRASNDLTTDEKAQLLPETRTQHQGQSPNRLCFLRDA